MILGYSTVAGQPQLGWHLQSWAHAQACPQQQPGGVGSQAQGVGQGQSSDFGMFNIPFGPQRRCVDLSLYGEDERPRAIITPPAQGLAEWGWDPLIGRRISAGGHSYPSRLQKPLERVRRDLGLPYRWTPHGLRRTFNNLLRVAGVDRQALRSLTGHSSEAMTGLYSTVGRDEKKAAVASVVTFTRRGGHDE